jgi:hypothetical protein
MRLVERPPIGPADFPIVRVPAKPTGWPSPPEPRNRREWLAILPQLAGDDALSETMRLTSLQEEGEWQRKGSPEPELRFTQYITRTRFGKLLASPAGVAAVKKLVNSFAREGEYGDAEFAVEFLFAFDLIWLAIPDLEAALRPVREAGQLSQEAVDEIGTSLRLWLEKFERHLVLPKVKSTMKTTVARCREFRSFGEPPAGLFLKGLEWARKRIQIHQAQIDSLVRPVPAPRKLRKQTSQNPKG